MWNVRREEKVVQGFGEKSVGKRQTGGPGHRWRKIDLKEMGLENVD